MHKNKPNGLPRSVAALLISGLLLVLVVFGIAACDGTSESASQTSPVQITLQSLVSGTNKKAAGDNLIHLDQAWQTWSGHSAGTGTGSDVCAP